MSGDAVPPMGDGPRLGIKRTRCSRWLQRISVLSVVTGLGVSVGVMAKGADVHALGLGETSPIKIAEERVMGFLDGDVSEATLYKNCLFSIQNGLVYVNLRLRKELVSTESSARINRLTRERTSPLTPSEELRSPPKRCLIGLFSSRRSEGINLVYEVQRRFLTDILIRDGNLQRFPYFGLSNLRTVWADPRTARHYERITTNISGIPGSTGGFFNRFINLDHLIYLPEHAGGRAYEQEHCRPFSKFSAVLMALMFLAVSTGLSGYGVYMGRQIGGWAVWFVIAAWPNFLAASWLFLSGVLGWNL